MSDSLTSSPKVVEKELVHLPDYVNMVDVSPDGSTMVAASVSGHVAIGDMSGNIKIIDAHRGDVVAARWSRSGLYFASCGIDGAARIWDRAGALVAESTHRGWASSLSWRPSGDEVAVGVGRKVVRLLANGLKSVNHDELPATIGCLDWSSDGRRLYVGINGGVATFQGAPQRTAYFPWNAAPLTVAGSPDGKWVVTGNQDASLHVWKVSNGSDLEMTGFPMKVSLVAWRGDSLRLANASFSEITEWDFSGKGPKGSKPIGMLGHSGRVVGLGYSPSRPDILGSVGKDGSLCLWRPVKSGRSLIHAHQSHENLTAMAWFPSSPSIICGTKDGRVIVFDMSDVLKDVP